MPCLDFGHSWVTRLGKKSAFFDFYNLKNFRIVVQENLETDVLEFLSSQLSWYFTVSSQRQVSVNVV